MLHIAFDELFNKFVSGTSFLGCAINDAQDYSFLLLEGKGKLILEWCVCVWRGGRRSKCFVFSLLHSNKSIDMMFAMMLATQA